MCQQPKLTMYLYLNLQPGALRSAHQFTLVSFDCFTPSLYPMQRGMVRFLCTREVQSSGCDTLFSPARCSDQCSVVPSLHTFTPLGGSEPRRASRLPLSNLRLPKIDSSNIKANVYNQDSPASSLMLPHGCGQASGT